MANNPKVNAIIDNMIANLSELKKALQEDKNEVQAQSVEPPVFNRRPLLSESAVNDDFSSFESLAKALQSNKWPEAVNPNFVCSPTSETAKLERGRGIIKLMIEEDLADKKFLDMGCGQGHTAYLAADEKTVISVGYDIKSYENWASMNKPNLKLTTDFELVKSEGPYDVIVLFDVLDHLKAEDPTTFLKKVASVLTDSGRVYMRTHPFPSRHATHLYNDLNKAYIHLVFSPSEIRQLIPTSSYEEPNAGINYPIKTYTQIIADAGLKVENRRDITEKVEPFFKIPKIAERIMKNTNTTSFPEFQMGLQFLDYILKK